MTNILDNELVKKYFGNLDSRSKERRRNWAMADAVLSAMQEPIRKGQRVLRHDGMGDHAVWTESIVGDEDKFYTQATNEWHPGLLILPPAFQKKECRAGFLKCRDCGEEIIHKPKPAPEHVPGCEQHDHNEC